MKKRHRIHEHKASKEETKEGAATDYNDDFELYALMMNNALPRDIRILGYAEVPNDFNARFKCTYREYKYFFNLKDMNLEKMKLAAEKLVGEHDFRNFCKRDKAKAYNEQEQNFIRTIMSITFDPVFGSGTSSIPLLNMYVCTVRGTAFLWHQIRFTMAAFFLIGSGKEQLELIDLLLDVDKVPDKPIYDMASDKPLILNN